MHASTRSSVVLGLLLVMVTRSLPGQESTGRFLFVLGLGAGAAHISCSACTSSGQVGGSNLTILFGYAVTQHLRIGYSSDLWSHAAGTRWYKALRDLAVSVSYYPATIRHGLFVEGGLGLSSAEVSLTDSTGLRRYGWDLTAAIGFDLKPRSKVSLVPRLAVSLGSLGDMYYPTGSNTLFARGWTHEVVSVGLGLALH